MAVASLSRRNFLRQAPLAAAVTAIPVAARADEPALQKVVDYLATDTNCVLAVHQDRQALLQMIIETTGVTPSANPRRPTDKDVADYHFDRFVSAMTAAEPRGWRYAVNNRRLTAMIATERF